jgi:NADPH:quinone reductase-like Zn-dependent oxidoreductase
MRSLVICPENFDKLTSRCKKVHSANIHGHTIYYSLLESENPQFNPDQFPDSVLVKKKAFSCNYRDIGIMLSRIPLIEETIKNNSTRAEFAYFPFGSDFSGEVMAVGKNIKNLKINDHVIPNADYASSTQPGVPTNFASAEYEILRGSKLIKIPDSMPFEVGGCFTISAQTTYSMIQKLNIKEGENILITGANSNTSLFAINALKNKNVNIYGLVRSRERKTELLSLGLKDLFVDENTDLDLAQNMEIKSFLANNRGFDCVIDPFMDSYFLRSLSLLRPGGRYTSCGISNQFTDDRTIFDLKETALWIIGNNLTIYGNCLGSTKNLEDALSDYSNGKLEVLIDEVIQNKPEEFFERTFKSKNNFGKIIYKYK